MHDERATPRQPKRRCYRLPDPLALLALANIMSGIAFTVSTASAADAVVTQQRAAQLAYLVRQDCGSCHGMTLAGGLGPPLLPAQLNGKPAIYLKHLILNGSPGTAMPGWSPLLTEADAEWIAQRLLKGFPDAR